METDDTAVRLAVVGLGKMGLSHLAVANGLPDFNVVAVCDHSGYVLDVLKRYTGIGDTRASMSCYGLNDSTPYLSLPHRARTLRSSGARWTRPTRVLREAIYPVK